jgi:hypothetical protein
MYPECFDTYEKLAFSIGLRVGTLCLNSLELKDMLLHVLTNYLMYSGASLIQMPLIQVLHIPDHFSEKQNT